MSKNQEVKKIIEYLTEKVTSLRNKIKDYESPIMQDMAKNSPHLQYDYTRLKAELQSHEDILLAIQKFTKEED